MKLISWNVNGLRAIVQKGFNNFLSLEKPDFLCLQEIKIGADKIEGAQFDFPGYLKLWNPAERPGYSGTAILVKESLVKKNKPFELEKKLKWDDEGRVQILDIGKHYLFNIYFPNAGRELLRLDFKRDFNRKLLKVIKKYEKVKPVIITGDYNVAHCEIDLARPKSNHRSAGFTPQEREDMDTFVSNGLVDSFRYLYPDRIQYTWWSYMFNARKNNVGWRIDYFCVSDKIKKNIKTAKILDKALGSDHCPIVLEI